ncbi:MAG: STAS domain-containing protein [Gammaproteobacteria bacterium]|nr:STAS domain-containing protein [Gammaproteobacteria bacterium]
MPIASTVDGNKVNIVISGRFDFSSHKEFRDVYRNAPSGSDNEFIIDLSATDYIDSSALGMLLLLREHAGSDHAKIKLQACRDNVKDILIVSNFDKLFTIP